MYSDAVVIVGGGQAAIQTAVSLRQEGFEGRIVIVGSEGVLPYQRPPLSKAFLAGQIQFERLLIRPPPFFEKEKIEIRLGISVTAVRRAEKQIVLEGGEVISYRKLVLCTGGRPRRITCPGGSHPKLFYLREMSDVHLIQPHLVSGAHLALIGAGYIGLEIAAVARKLGLEVTIIEAMPRVLSRVTSPEVSAFFQREHEAQGVNILCGVAVTAITGSDDRPAVVTEGAGKIEADIVIAGIGLVPNVELAVDAGLDCDNGILVDENCQTSDPDIFAAGDCTLHPSFVYQTRMRLESVPNAIEQGRTAASAICGKSRPYIAVPWFWSDQYDIKLQTAGVNSGYDNVVLRGAPESRSFAAYYTKADRLLAVDAINRPLEFSQAKAWIAEGKKIPSAILSNEQDDTKVVAPA